MHRILVGVVAGLAVAVTVAMVLLAGGPPASDEADTALPLENATLLEVEPVPADDTQTLPAGAVDVVITARLDASGEVIELLPVVDPTGATFRAGQRVRVEPLVGSDATYSIYDFRRETPLAILAVAFCLVVVAFGRFQGLRALIGLALTALVVVAFLIPAILAGREPVVVALTAAFAIMLLTLYLSHGVNPKTTAAVVGTTLALLLTAGLSLLFVELVHLTGLSDEDAVLANLGSASGLSLRGLLLAGIVIGGLGVLDDVTVSQSSLVFELAEADRRAGFGTLVRRALRVGRDHVAASVNTLFLAYAGAFLPLLILFATGVDPIATVLTSEVVATEIVRTLVGSIGLIAAVPLTTALAATLVLSQREAPLTMPGRGAAGGREPPERERRAARERGRRDPVAAGAPVAIPGALALEPGWSPPQEGVATRPERPLGEPATRRQRARPPDDVPAGQPATLARTARSGGAPVGQPPPPARPAPPGDDLPRRRPAREDRPTRKYPPSRQEQFPQTRPRHELLPEDLPVQTRPRQDLASEDRPVQARDRRDVAPDDLGPEDPVAPPTGRREPSAARDAAPERRPAPAASRQPPERSPRAERASTPVQPLPSAERALDDVPTSASTRAARRGPTPAPREPAVPRRPPVERRPVDERRLDGGLPPAARRVPPPPPTPPPAQERPLRARGADGVVAPPGRREPGTVDRGATAAGAAQGEAATRHDSLPSPQERRPAERALVEPRPGEPAPTERLPLVRRAGAPAPDRSQLPIAEPAVAPADPPPMMGRAGGGRRLARPPEATPSPPEIGRPAGEDRPSPRGDPTQPPAATEGRRTRSEPPPRPAATPDRATRRTRGRGDGSPKRAEPTKGRRPRPRTALDAEQEQLEAWLKQMRNPYGRAEDNDGDTG